MRPRLAAIGRCLDIGHRLVALVRGEQYQAEIVLGLQMPLLCGAAVPAFGLAKVGGNAPAELVRLAQVELCVGIAGDGQRAPFGHRLLIVARLPGIDAVLDVREGGYGQCRRSCSERQGDGGGECSHP